MIFLNETDFKDELPLVINFNFDRVTPDVRRVGIKYLKPILGKDLAVILSDAYAAENLTADQAALMAYIKPVVAHLAIWKFTPKSNITHTDNGLQANHSGESKPAFEWQVDNYEDSLLENGFDAMDELIEYLEEVANTDFPDWLNSEGCTLVRSNVINTAKRFTEYVPKLKASRYLFTYIRPIMTRIEKKILPAVLSSALYEEIKTQIKADSLSEANLKLMPFIEAAVAHKTWADAMIELNFQTDGEGVYLLNNAFSGTVKGKEPVEKERVSTVRDFHLGISSDQLSELYNYLVENLDTYPLFKDGETYHEESTGSCSIDNEDTWGVTAFM